MPIVSSQLSIDFFDGGMYQLVLGEIAPEHGEKTAIIDIADGSETSYSQLKSYTESMAGWLNSEGITKGDVVAIHCPNSLAFVVSVYGAWRIGATITPISLLATAEDVQRQLEDSQAKILLTVAALGDASTEGGTAAGLDSEHIVYLDKLRGLKQIIAERRSAPEVSIDPEEDLAALCYSSGTTGLPKGVMLTHRNLTSNLQQAAAIPIVTSDDVVLGVLPFFHIYGLTALSSHTLAQRATIVALPRMELQTFLEAHQKHNVTFTYIAPPLAVLLAKHPIVDNYKLNLRGVFSGAATLDADLALAVEKRLGIHVQQGYGMTETSPLAFANIDPEANRGSVGRLAVNSEYKIVDPETLEEIPVPDSGNSEPGELWYKGPQVMKGYYNRPEETAETLVDGGWLRTGDIAVHDSDGLVYIVDRLKELIKYKGYQVPPAELEALLLSHEAIADAAVVGAPNEEGEEIPKAFLVRQSNDAGASLTAEEVMEFVAQRVAPYKKVREVAFIDAIPKSSTGKILRRELRGT